MILQVMELEQVELVGPTLSEQHENAEELWMEKCFPAFHDLMAVNKFDVKKLVGAKLP